MGRTAVFVQVSHFIKRVLKLKRFDYKVQMPLGPSDPEYWQKRWEEGQIGWHEAEGNRWLLANVHILAAGRDKVRVFIPLCGKSLDIKCLADKGHDVVGVETSSIAVKQFFGENNIPFTVIPAPECNGSLYKSNDGKIQLYCCSIFDFGRHVAGEFDAVWDRGSLVALPPDVLGCYHAVMEPLMAEGCQYIFERLVYPVPENFGPPHVVPMERLQKLFGSKYKIEVIERYPSPSHQEKFKADYFDIEIIRITRKAKAENNTE